MWNFDKVVSGILVSWSLFLNMAFIHPFKPFFAVFSGWLFLAAVAQAQPLQVHPQTLDLGPVKLGTRLQGEVVLENLGSDELEIAVRTEGEYFTASPETLSLAGQTKRTITVDFEARVAGEHQGRLIVEAKTFFKKEPFALSLRAQALRARIHLVPEQTLHMGALPVGETSRKTIALANPGLVALTMDSLYLKAGETPFHIFVTSPLQLDPGEEKTLEVAFTPRRGGIHRDHLVFHSSDLDPPHLELELTGEALVSRVAFSPLPEVGLDFNSLEVGHNRTRHVTLLNQGRADLLIKGVEVSGGAFTSPWDSTGAAAVPAGERRRIGVVFRPPYEGPASGVIILSTNDPENPHVEIPLLGRAQLTPPQIEVLNEGDIEFGNVAIDKYERDHLVVWNRGGTLYTVHLDIEETTVGEFEIKTASVLLPPGQFKKIELKFSPRETGERRAVLLVGTESGRRRIQMHGVGRFLEVTPTTVDFDRVVVGQSSAQQIEILNSGNAGFTITNIRSNNQKNFKLQSQVSPVSPFNLAADGLRPLPVSLTFTPVARGVTSGILQLEGHWDQAFETREILLNGTGIAADLELHPSASMDFDYVVVGEKAAQTLVATNTGDTDLQVEAHPESQEALADPSSFSLPPGASTPLQVFFAPEALGKRAAQIRLISNDVKEKALPLKIKGQGALASLDLTQVVSVLVSRKARFDTLKVGWNNTPVVLHDQSKIDLVFHLADSLSNALVGRKFNVSWIQLDDNYDEQGGAKQTEVQLHDSGEERVLAEKFNLRLQEKSNKRVRVTIASRNHPGAPLQKISQVFEAGGWKWEFEAKPLVSFLSVRPGRYYTDVDGKVVKGRTERLVGLPGFAFFGYHNVENPSVSGVHLTATGNVLEALSTENSIAVSLGLALSLYKDRFMFGIGWDVYDRRSKAVRKGTQDYIMTFKYWGLF